MILLANSARPKAVVNGPYCLSPPKVLPLVNAWLFLVKVTG
jgi:hypothetical protein